MSLQYNQYTVYTRSGKTVRRELDKKFRKTLLNFYYINRYPPRMFFVLITQGGSSEDPKFTCPILLTDSSCAVDLSICWRKFILV